MASRDIYLKIEGIPDYSPVRPMDKTAPPIIYGRDCLFGMGHPDGTIPEAEIGARSLNAVVYRQYQDASYTVPVVRKLVDADINEPIYSRRVPGALIYAYPGETLRITVFNADVEPHSFHVHGLEYGIDSDGSWPFGTQSADGRRSDEICPGSQWTYTFNVTTESIGAWPFHDHSHHPTAAIDRGLFGGIIVLAERDEEPPILELPPNLRDIIDKIKFRLPKLPVPPLPWPPRDVGHHGRHEPAAFIPGTMTPRMDPGERLRAARDRVRMRGPDEMAARLGAHSHNPGAEGGHPGTSAAAEHSHDHESVHEYEGSPASEHSHEDDAFHEDCTVCLQHGAPHTHDHDDDHFHEDCDACRSEAARDAGDPVTMLRHIHDVLDEWALHEIVIPKPPVRKPKTLHVPIFLHAMKDDRVVPLFDSGDIEELTGIYELEFSQSGSFEYFCRYHPFMQGTVEVVAGGPASVTVNIVDAPAMGFSPATVSVGIGGKVRWENHSVQHHTVTSQEGATMATHCLNGRGFIGNSPTVVAQTDQTIRWYVFNLDTSPNWHNFHLHAMRWQFANETIDVRSIGPAESFVVETKAPPVLLLSDEMKAIQSSRSRPADAKRYELVGDFVFHCHVHHHMMNGMVGLVRARQSVWLTDAMVEELKSEQGFPLDTGSNGCPTVTDPCRGAGRWEEVSGDPEVTLMHSMLVPGTQKVLYWGYTRADQSRLWDYSTSSGTYSAPTNQPADVVGTPNPMSDSDLWSAEHEYLDTPSGAILAHGGFTPRRSFVFDCAGLSWSRVQDTAHDRFYSTSLALEDGRVMTLFGSGSKSFEIYEHGVGWTPPVTLPAAFHNYQYYPWTFLLPDGRLVIAGHQTPSRRFDPAAPASDPTQTFTPIHGADRSGGAENGTAVLLTLRPPAYAARILVAGGSNPTLLSSAELLDLSAASPAWATLPNMNYPRGNLTAVLLPTGEVFVAGGIIGGPDGGPAELIDPESPAPIWQEGPAMTYQRGYHSTMLLLADGSILGGGDPARDPDGSPSPHERFYPWYFDVARPEITNVPGQVNYGQTITIATPDAHDISQVVIMRPGAVTHGFNMTQRAIECAIGGHAPTSLNAQAPANPRLAPPGWYLLFILGHNRAPSLGRWIRLTT